MNNLDFAIDWCLSPKIGDMLKNAGYGAVRSGSHFLHQQTDDWIIARYAQDNKLIVLTNDDDFDVIFKGYNQKHYGYVRYEFPHPVTRGLNNSYTNILIQYLQINNIWDLYGYRILIDEFGNPDKHLF